MRRSFRYHDTYEYIYNLYWNFAVFDLPHDPDCTFNVVKLRISTSNLARVPTFTDKSLRLRRNIGASSPVDRSSTTSSISLRNGLPSAECAYTVK